MEPVQLLPSLEVSGTSREIGVIIGQKFGKRIKEFIIESDVANTLHPFIQTDPGKDFFDNLLPTNQKLYPELFEQLSGISEGSGVPLLDIYLINFFEVLLAYSLHNDGASLRWEKACSDAAYKGDCVWRLAHTEDMPIDNAARFCWMIHEKVTGEGLIHAFCYPGMFPGNAFSWNEYGIIITVNYIRSEVFNSAGASVPFMCRTFLRCKTIAEIISIIPIKRASSISLNVISISEERMVNIEFKHDCYAVKEISGAFKHVNHLEMLPGPASKIHSSTQQRALRFGEFQPEEFKTPLVLLSDTKNPEYPIYRTSTPPDTNSTAATVYFDVLAKKVQIFVGKATESEPYLEYDL